MPIAKINKARLLSSNLSLAQITLSLTSQHVSRMTVTLISLTVCFLSRWATEACCRLKKSVCVRVGCVHRRAAQLPGSSRPAKTGHRVLQIALLLKAVNQWGIWNIVQAWGGHPRPDTPSAVVKGGGSKDSRRWPSVCGSLLHLKALPARHRFLCQERIQSPFEYLWALSVHTSCRKEFHSFIYKQAHLLFWTCCLLFSSDVL